MTPTAEGFYWAKWHTANQGEVLGEWEVVRVVQNSVDRSDPDYFMVMMTGLLEWQRLENFEWGPQVFAPDSEQAGAMVVRFR